MAGDPEGLVRFEAGGKKYTAIFGFKAMKAVEVHYDKPFFRAIQAAMPQLDAKDLGDKAKIAEASADIRFSDIGKLFECALLRHHPDLSEEQIEDLIDEIGLERASSVIGDALTAALAKEGGGDGKEGPPRSRKR